MDVNQTLISSGITIGTYGLYKIIQFARRYYITSSCHDNKLEIEIVPKPDEIVPKPDEDVPKPDEDVKVDILKVKSVAEPVK